MASRAVDIPLSCRCGHVRGVARKVAPTTGFRFTCYCTDCQAFAAFLGSEVLDAAGGTDIVQLPAGLVKLTEGTDTVRCVSCSAQVLRWYADCCRTPIANSAAKPGFPVVALIHPFLDIPRDPALRDAMLGRPLCRLYAGSATGPVPSGAPTGFSLALFLRRIWKLIGWRNAGLDRPNPFFDPRTGAPIATAQPINRPASSRSSST